ncbi:8-amino-7-oxononanoate synthase [Filimonas lacunae]|uniref:8-amino-7-oxononanoate synthase n=1 Tax=Filimonas lacunae TaxID=477680 RepID=A0A173ML46_9BACT|nr:8-amino-7-oxononanoate synthase [Filimonas lacunae]BAV08207.1 8-amino-7-oxononanoate synthase [Filimonas lacunae]SIT33033.1 8-amino-7-oxononanoate synthase [Filimonas lacunae]
MYNDLFLQPALAQRTENNAFRSLRLPSGSIDFCSNDYLGLVHSGVLARQIAEQTLYASGSTGSRLLAGNSVLAEETEAMLAGFHQAGAALLFNSGYDANIGVLSAIPQKGDTIIYDQLCHASIRDGIRLSFAQSFSFRHNDREHLQQRLERTTGNVFVVTESVFSMDGDTCPLPELVALCEQYGAHMIIDEAHATGVIGNRGEGWVQYLDMQERVFCRMHTFGKACGCHGAVVLGSKRLKDFLINFSRSFIYTTALPDHAIAAIRASYALFPGMQQQRAHLQSLVQQFTHNPLSYQLTSSNTPIQGVLVPGNLEVKKMARHLQQHNLDVRAILYPTVPNGSERLRVVLHAYNTPEEVGLLLSSIENQ